MHSGISLIRNLEENEGTALDGTILDVERLKTNFYTFEGVVKAIDEVSFSLEKGDTLGIVGETGCGKTVTVLSILQLILPPGSIEGGKVMYHKSDSFSINLLKKNESYMSAIRGNEISMIFQEASSALNPVLNVNKQVSESFLLHGQKELCESVMKDLSNKLLERNGFLKPITRTLLYKYQQKLKRAKENKLKRGQYGVLMKQEAKRRVISLLECLGIPNPSEVIKRYPHELSGGMQQRVVISMALACNPNILIADEPTSNLDVTIQAQILDLIEKLKKDYQSSILFITHDLGVVSHIASKVIVLYAGILAEFAPVAELFGNPLHPYTRALLNSIPKIGKKDRLESIKGNVPNLINPPSGCRFHPRCPYVMDICKDEKPGLYSKPNSKKGIHLVSCFLYRN